MARTILKLGKNDLVDTSNKPISIGDEVVILPVGGWCLRRGEVVRETKASIFVGDFWVSKAKCGRHCMKL